MTYRITTILRWLVIVAGVGLFLAGSGFFLYKFYNYRMKSHALAFYAAADRAFREQRNQDGVQNLVACVTLAPEFYDAYIKLAEALHRRGASQEAARWMDTLVERNPEAQQAYVRRAVYRLNTGMIEAAEADIKKALELSPDDRDALNVSLMLALREGNPETVRARAKHLAELYPWHVSVYPLMGRFEMQQGAPTEAISWLQRGLTYEPKDVDMLWMLSNLLLEREDLRGASPLIQTFRDNNPQDARAVMLFARAKFVQGEWIAAADLFSQMRPAALSQPEMLEQVDYYRSTCYYRTGDYARDLEVCREAIKNSPKSVLLKERLVTALLANGQVDEAVEEFRSLTKFPGAPHRLAVELARLLLLRNIWHTASDRDWEEFEEAVGEAQVAVPDDPLIPILRAESLFARHRWTEGEKLLLAAQEKAPRQLSLRIALAGVACRKRDWKAAGKWLDDAGKDLGDSVPLRIARGTFTLWRDGPAADMVLRELAGKTESFSEKDLLTLWQGLASLSYEADDVTQTAKLYQQISKTVPDNTQTWLAWLDLVRRFNRLSLLDGILANIQRIEGRGPHWQYGRAISLRMREGEKDKNLLDQAQRNLAAARSLRPMWPQVPLLSAEIDELQGNPSQAVGKYLLAVRLGETRPTTVRRVVQFLRTQQRFVEVDQLMRYIEQRPSPCVTDVGRPGAETAIRLDPYSQYLEAAQREATESSALGELLWLGGLYEIVGRRAGDEQRGEESAALLKKAEAIFRRGVAMAPASPESHTALIQFFARTGKKEEAARAIAAAGENLSGLTAELTLAQAYEVTGDFAQAEKAYQELLDTSSEESDFERLVEFYSRQQKEADLNKTLRRVVDGKLPATRQASIWARRRYARALAVKGDIKDRQEALRLVEKNQKLDPSSSKDQQLKAILLLSGSSFTWRREALRILEDLHAIGSLGPDEEFLLGQLYISTGNWTRASAILQNLLEYHGDEPRYVVPFVNAVLRNREVARAESWLTWLETVAPEQFSTVRLRAEALYARDRASQAIDKLRAFLRRPDAQPADKATRTDLVATAYQEIARGLRQANRESALVERVLAEAEMLRRSLLAEHPEQGMPLAVLLAERGNLKEAVSLATKSWKSVPMNLVADTLGQLLAVAANTPHFTPLEQILDAALEEHKRPVELLTLAANVAQSKSDYPRAETILREILSKDADSAFATQNLAKVLLLQGSKISEAVELIDTAVDLAGPIMTLRDLRGLIYMAASEPRKARTEFDAALAVDANNPVYLFHKAQACLALKDKKTGQELIAQARKAGLKQEQLFPFERAKAVELGAVESPSN